MSPKKAANLVPKPHLHHETGITDDAAVEGYDLIHNAEVEEEKTHANESPGETMRPHYFPAPSEGDAANTASMGNATARMNQPTTK
ncbi:hypothetical protein PHISP_04161 [Aspergillus sp. HF37]|nr:hypothetical protein PHISP_04161 [Aspergillus sp. HF37]